MDAQCDFAAAVAVEGAGDGGGAGGGGGSLVAELFDLWRMRMWLVFLSDDAVARGEEELGHGAEEAPRPDLLLAVDGGDAAGRHDIGCLVYATYMGCYLY